MPWLKVGIKYVGLRVAKDILIILMFFDVFNAKAHMRLIELVSLDWKGADHWRRCVGINYYQLLRGIEHGRQTADVGPRRVEQPQAEPFMLNVLVVFCSSAMAQRSAPP